MTFLDKLEFLMKGKGINKSVLAKESGIPYTTLDAFYKKGYQNAKLSTLKKLSNYFDVPLDYLVNEDIKETESIIEAKYEILAAAGGGAVDGDQKDAEKGKLIERINRELWSSNLTPEQMKAVLTMIQSLDKQVW